ncbi:hypothetical protein BDV28DRAFT_155025 [Aspergillus coremiiformis]|uniref:Zn(2)-C6 fungal-type domain-containing protein n=1 Tax=Aspergillus coremiiformis TaxID=138285 RepID=A0A5N6ZIC9_9EURO|nr:hypothetical protein BDV28DRAFT_155025 [Aspergillus coremiiformis]
MQRIFGDFKSPAENVTVVTGISGFCNSRFRPFEPPSTEYTSYSYSSNDLPTAAAEAHLTQCTRCQSKKIRCNRVQPRCDKCEAIDAECTYVPRKTRAKRQNGAFERDILRNILRRLERLEDHCQLDRGAGDRGDASRSISISSVSSDVHESGPASVEQLHCSQPQTPQTQTVVHSMLNGIKDDRARSLLSGNVFCHLRNVESRLFENETCVKAMEVAMAEVERLQYTQESDVLDVPVISKEMAKNWINSYYKSYQFEGFRVPLDKNFVLSIPDLLEIPHVRLDNTSQIIYYNVLLQGLLLYPEYYPGSDGWLDEIRNNLPDMFAAFVMVSMTLEGCNSELSWKIFGYACSIARALGYFSVDEHPKEQNPLFESPNDNESEVDKNRKRFEFWHLLRMDCLFRLSFGKPALIPDGSWTVNFPDPTITGIDDASTRFIQIHFLVSMRLTLALLKYLDFLDARRHENTDIYDKVLDGLIAEVQTIMSDWNASLMSGATHAYWGISLILLHQFIPFFILCADIIGSHGRNNVEDDFALVTWLKDFVETAAKERVELKPIAAIAKGLIIACQQVQSSVR